jgi:hypothetical protein
LGEAHQSRISGSSGGGETQNLVHATTIYMEGQFC